MQQQQQKTILSIDKDMEDLELSYTTAVGNVKWYNSFGKQFVDF